MCPSTLVYKEFVLEVLVRMSVEGKRFRRKSGCTGSMFIAVTIDHVDVGIIIVMCGVITWIGCFV
jgi:hypothetical protein